MAYYIQIKDRCEYLKDDSIGFSVTAFTSTYNDRKTYSEKSDAIAVVNSLGPTADWDWSGIISIINPEVKSE